MRGRTAELLLRHLLTGDRLHDVGAGDEHVRRPLGHQHEVGDRGRVHGTARARPEDQRDLRHDTRGLNIPPEDLGVTRKRDDALLNPRSARVVDPDNGATDLQRHVHHLADLLREHLRQRATKDGEVLREHADGPAEHRPVAGHDGVTRRAPVAHSELDLTVAHKTVELDKRALVEQPLDPLPRQQLPARTLLRNRRLAACMRDLLTQLAEPAKLVLRRLVRTLQFIGGHRNEPTATSSGETCRGRAERHQRGK